MENKPNALEVGAIRNLINGLILLQSHLRLYGENNANVVHTTDRLLAFLNKLFVGAEQVTVYVARHAFVFEDGLIDRNNRNFEKFAGSLFAHGVATLTFHRGATGRELQLFLQLVARKPAETWDEGGLTQCLHTRGVEKISVREMTEQDFLLMDSLSGVPTEQLQHQRSRLWENFALSLLHGLHLPEPDPKDPEQWAPGVLAARINELLGQSPESDQQTVTRDASRFLLTLKHEKVRIYRAAALHNLANFVNHLSPGLRQMFLDQAFTLNLDADLAEGFLRNLSDQSILDALRNAAEGKGYIPPVALKLLGRLAQERGFTGIVESTVSGENEDTASSKVKQLFKADDFDKYVPKAYQSALLAIIHKESLPPTTTEALERLKATLEPANMERHLGEIIFDILHQLPDEKHLEGFCSNLLSTLRFCQTMRNYVQMARIYERCRSKELGEGLRQEVESVLASSAFIGPALDDLQSLAPEQSEALWEMILALPEPFVEPLLERLGTETRRSARLACLRGLVRLGPACLASAVSRLGDSRWFVVRNMLCLLREIAPGDALAEIRKCLRHPHPKVQQEALRTCLVMGDERAVPALLQALEAKVPAERLSAINLASLSSHPQVITRLIELLQSGSLLDYQLDVKRAAVRALAVNAAPQSPQVFAELLASRNLLHSRSHELLKLEIISALAGFPSAVAQKLLQPQTSSSSEEIARAAQLILKRLAGASP